MADHDKHDKHEQDRTIAALFQSRAEARATIAALHKAKYSHTWLGSTSVAETAGGDETVTVETGGFFSGTQSLVDALVSRGVTGDAARRLEHRVEAGNALLTVDPKDRDLREALDIIEAHGGRSAHALGAGSEWGAWPATGRTFTDLNGDEEFEEALFMRR